MTQPVALVTGGALRIGGAISRRLAADGFAVAVNYLSSKAAAETLVGEIRAQGGAATAVAADITSESAPRELVAEVSAQLGDIDLLVNNAAIFERRDFQMLDEDIWRRHMQLNLEAPFRLSLLVGRGMWERGAGRIVNICGVAGIDPLDQYLPYSVTKAGLETLTRGCARALAPRVQVNAVAPGAILFPDGTPEQQQRDVLAAVPAGQAGRPEDVAAAVAFFAAAPDYITGTVLPVDGGASTTGP